MVQMEAIEVHAARCHLQKERYLKHHYLTHSCPCPSGASCIPMRSRFGCAGNCADFAVQYSEDQVKGLSATCAMAANGNLQPFL